MHPLCRLCQCNTLPVFTKEQLGKYQVQYYRCCSCHSLQTEKPLWIDEVYQNLNFAKDVGLVSRTLFAARLILALAIKKKFGRNDYILDFGGGTGLLTRMIRDFGLNGFWSDKYAENIFAVGFEQDLTTVRQPKLITAFEVFAHLTYPKEEIEQLLKQEPEYLLFSTRVYKGEGQEWGYLMEDGQHVQFYSLTALAFLAKQHGYYFSTDGHSYHLFSREKTNKNLCKKCYQRALNPSIEKKSRWSSRTEEDVRLLLNPIFPKNRTAL